ncbi:hypothetical protein QYF61_021217 [Mycteria americana]|uniref:Uncharacterized protein n=1 Tax=Mycteria americana TaxID=33587 RepID=A0AAN7SFJ2_MYCAM|nr:hypothetical protein QYF61_021217 [Mycteria americana]
MKTGQASIDLDKAREELLQRMTTPEIRVSRRERKECGPCECKGCVWSPLTWWCLLPNSAPGAQCCDLTVGWVEEPVLDLACPSERRWLRSSLPNRLTGQEAQGHVQQLAEQALKYIQQKKRREATKVRAEGPRGGLRQLKPAERLGVRKGHRGGQEPSGKGVPRSGAKGGEATEGKGRAGRGGPTTIIWSNCLAASGLTKS